MRKMLKGTINPKHTNRGIIPTYKLCDGSTSMLVFCA